MTDRKYEEDYETEVDTNLTEDETSIPESDEEEDVFSGFDDDIDFHGVDYIDDDIDFSTVVLPPIDMQVNNILQLLHIYKYFCMQISLQKWFQDIFPDIGDTSNIQVLFNIILNKVFLASQIYWETNIYIYIYIYLLKK